MIKGIDVSKYQGINPVINNTSLGFCLIKASEALHKDPMCEAHAKEIGDSHLLRAFYHFFRMKVDALAQAEYFCSVIHPYLDSYSLPPVLDLEDPNAHGPIQTAVQHFLDKVEELTGYQPIIYTGTSFILPHKLNFSKYPLWDACYRNNPATPYAGWEKPLFWQYTDHTTITGEAAPVDGDLFFGTPADLLALTKSNTYKGGLSPDEWVKKYKVHLY